MVAARLWSPSRSFNKKIKKKLSDDEVIGHGTRTQFVPRLWSLTNVSFLLPVRVLANVFLFIYCFCLFVYLEETSVNMYLYHVDRE